MFSSTGCAESVPKAEDEMDDQNYLLIDAQLPEIPECPDVSDPDSWDEETIAQFDAWWNAKAEHQEIEIPNREQLQDFIRESAQRLSVNRETPNYLYSPVGLWLCLHTLADLTEGNTQAQILQVLGEQTDAVRDEQLEAVFRSLYWEEASSVCIPAISAWLDTSTTISEPLLNRFAEKHTSVFQGQMGDMQYDAALQQWLNEQSRGLLKDIVSQLRFSPRAGLSVCSTLYLKSAWSSPFDKQDTSTDVFYATDSEYQTDFMHSSDEGVVFQGNGFTAAVLDFSDGGSVLFILPDMGVSPDELLNEEDVFHFLFSGKNWEDGLYGKVNLSIPKMDVLSAMSLKSSLEKMGITDVFDTEAANFSSELSADKNLAISSLDQYARLTLDEDGVEAAAITLSDAITMIMPSKNEIDFTLNRPFLYAVMSENNIPLFIGIYEMP